MLVSLGLPTAPFFLAGERHDLVNAHAGIGRSTESVEHSSSSDAHLPFDLADASVVADHLEFTSV
jgi:hypothetical protein